MSSEGRNVTVKFLWLTPVETTLVDPETGRETGREFAVVGTTTDFDEVVLWRRCVRPRWFDWFPWAASYGMRCTIVRERALSVAERIYAIELGDDLHE